MSWDVTSGPGVTALGLAAARTVESARPDRLIEDPFAPALFAAAGAAPAMRTTWPEPGEEVTDTEALHLHGSRYIGLRTRIYDDALLEAARADAGQAVILGAGLDTRAFRLEPGEGFMVFEVDQPGVLAYKDDVLRAEHAEPRCIRQTVGTDLAGDWTWALNAAGFEGGGPTVWLAEGLLAYLDSRAQAMLIDTIGALSAPGSVLVLDRIAGDPAADGRLAGLSARSGIAMDQMIQAGGESPADRLARSGWEVEERSTSELAQHYGRDLTNPFGADSGGPPWLDTVFVTAKR